MRRVVPTPLEAAGQIVDAELRAIAQQAYAEEIHRWERKCAQLREELSAQLRRPQYCQELGLPLFLPDETIVILARTMTGDQLGPKRPRIDVVFRRFGLAAP